MFDISSYRCLKTFSFIGFGVSVSTAAVARFNVLFKGSNLATAAVETLTPKPMVQHVCNTYATKYLLILSFHRCPILSRVEKFYITQLNASWISMNCYCNYFFTFFKMLCSEAFSGVSSHSIPSYITIDDCLSGNLETAEKFML